MNRADTMQAAVQRYLDERRRLGVCAAESFFAEHARRVFTAVDGDSLSRAKVE